VKRNAAHIFLAALAPAMLWLAGCAEQPSSTAAAPSAAPEPARKTIGEKIRAAVATEVELPAGTELQVMLAEAVGSASSKPGERFQSTLHAPVVVDNKVVLPKGTTFSGKVVRAAPSGRLKTPAQLALTLDTLDWQGQSYPVSTSTVSRSARSHKKRNLALIGGGSGAGALIGGLAGGGAGALIGAGAGAAAGTAGAYATGKKDVLLPAETLLTFRLEAPVKIRKS